MNDIFTTKDTQQHNACKLASTLHGRKLNAEFSLQSASHNSHVNNQRHSRSQIRELCAMFIIRCYLRCYAYVVSFYSYFYHFLAAEALR